MNEFPKSVRDAMARQSVAGAHPDADLLTAFSERSTTEQERQSVLAHLATCSECREVLALAAPDTPQEVLQPEPNRLRRWFWIPALGAMAVVALSTALLLNRPAAVKQNATETAGASRDALPAAPSPAPQQQDEAKQENKTNALKKSESVGKAAPAADSYSGEKAPFAIPAKKKDKSENTPVEAFDRLDNSEARLNPNVVATTRDRLEAKQLAEARGGIVGGTLPAPSAPVLQSRASSAATVSGPNNQNAQSQVQQNVQNVPGQIVVRDQAETGSVRPELAQPAAAPQIAREESAPAFHGAMAKSSVATLPRAQWRISPEGRLERAFTNGAWTPLLSEFGFNALSVVVGDVWAGGGAGLLFHLTDNGNHWARVVIRDNGQALTSAITGIHFEDLRKGTIKTDKGESWVTQDAGVTWSRSQ